MAELCDTGQCKVKKQQSFQKGIRSIHETPPKAIKYDDLSATTYWGKSFNHSVKLEKHVR